MSQVLFLPMHYLVHDKMKKLLMKPVNWIILKSSGRGNDYGVGTFIKQISEGLTRVEDINIYIIELGFAESRLFNIKKINGITIFEIPVPIHKNGIDSKNSQEKLARNIARVIYMCINPLNRNIIHMNYLFQYFVAKEIKDALGGTIIFTQHVFTFDQDANSGYFDVEWATYDLVDKIVTVTKHGKEHLIKKGVSADKIQVIYNGINPEYFRYKNERIAEKYGLSREEKIILYSGRIDAIKGLDYLCLAMESLLGKMPDCRLVVAGNGNYEQLILSSRKFSGNISLLGFIPSEDIISLYQTATIGVIPSLEEHCSYVALEMLFCGLPVVASGVGGLKEIFLDNENALLVDLESVKSNPYGRAPRIDQLESNMLSLLTEDKLRASFSKNAKVRANNLFTTGIMVHNYLLITQI